MLTFFLQWRSWKRDAAASVDWKREPAIADWKRGFSQAW